jgi:hypothetical protein
LALASAGRKIEGYYSPFVLSKFTSPLVRTPFAQNPIIAQLAAPGSFQAARLICKYLHYLIKVYVNFILIEKIIRRWHFSVKEYLVDFLVKSKGSRAVVSENHPQDSKKSRDTN